MAGKDPRRKLADFDRHYMPDGVPEPEKSVTEKTGEHRSNLKRKAKGIARSLAEVFAYLTFNTSSLNESKKLLSIITNVSIRTMFIISILCIIDFIRSKFMYIDYIFVFSWIFSQRILSICHFRVEDGDASAEHWKDSRGRALAPDCFWNTTMETMIASDNSGLCLGIELNIWERAKV
jgi:hypothetical protein